METHRFIKLFISLSVFAVCARAAFATDAEWSYEEGSGPTRWAELDPHFHTCSDGKQQSPVDISSAISAELPPIAIDWKPGEGSMTNNGHTIQIDMPAGSTLKRGEAVYELMQLHFHAPSEHHVEGEPFAMEAHFVHRNRETGSYGVLAVFVTEGADNEAFAEIADKFSVAEGADVKLDNVDLGGLVPSSLDYWFYEGSLTTPPCSEDVDWMIVRQPLEASAEDIGKFIVLYPMNARPVMPPHRRFILTSP